MTYLGQRLSSQVHIGTDTGTPPPHTHTAGTHAQTKLPFNLTEPSMNWHLWFLFLSRQNYFFTGLKVTCGSRLIPCNLKLITGPDVILHFLLVSLGELVPECSCPSVAPQDNVLCKFVPCFTCERLCQLSVNVYFILWLYNKGRWIIPTVTASLMSFTKINK